MSNRAVLVQCGSSKVDVETLVYKLYDHWTFEARWGLGMVVGDPYVMSAKHGLVAPNEKLDPYEHDLREEPMEERDAWGRGVVSELPNHYDTLVLLGGHVYVNAVEFALEEVDNNIETVHTPFQAFSGNGKQGAWCREATEQLLDGASLDEVLPE